MEKTLQEEPMVLDYIFKINTKEEIQDIEDNFLDHPIFADATKDDIVYLRNKFKEISEFNNKFPGFIFAKIDTSTQLVYVNYYPQETFK